MNDLLTDPLFTVETPSGIRRLSLPGLLAALGQDEVLSYPALRRHQQDPFHVFLCQLAAASLARAGLTSPVQTEAFWREALLQLAQGQACAWQLVVEDPTLPAFMQPPAVSRAEFNLAYKPTKGEPPKARSPDELDVLVTSKNHDIKAVRASDSEELWANALITLQTTTPYLGSGQQGVIRINSYSRAIVSVVSDVREGARFRESVSVLIDRRPSLIGGPWGYKPEGLVLTWLPTWDLKTSLAISVLDPYFIEAPRAIRLVSASNGIEVWNARTEKRLVGAEKGDAGDLWTVLKRSDDSWTALNPNRGFDPELLTAILFEDGYKLSALQKPRGHGTGDHYLLASVLARGKNPSSDGFHSVRLPIPPRATLALFGTAKETLGKFAKELLRDAAIVQKDCLRPALFSLYKGGLTEKDVRKAKKSIDESEWVKALVIGYSREWRAGYFPLLWLGAERNDLRELRSDWERQLWRLAKQMLRDAEQRAPVPAARRLRAAVRSEQLLELKFREKGFAEFLKETAHVDSDD